MLWLKGKQSVETGQTQTQIVDTAAPYMICEPELVDQLGLGEAEDIDKITIRHHTVEGALHRVKLAFLADDGDDIAIEATLFVPLEPYSLPSFLGLTNCLESICWAIDPFEEIFYFGNYPTMSEG